MLTIKRDTEASDWYLTCGSCGGQYSLNHGEGELREDDAELAIEEHYGSESGDNQNEAIPPCLKRDRWPVAAEWEVVGPHPMRGTFRTLLRHRVE